MRGVVYEAPHETRVALLDDPQIVEDTDAVVRVTLAGICGSDLHGYNHGDLMGVPAGVRIGHEFTGVVEAVGAGVRSVRPGDKVLAPFWNSCGTCWYCRQELYTSCERGSCFGWSAMWNAGGDVQGAQSERVRVPFADGTLERVPEALAGDEMDHRVLPLGDVFSTAYHALVGTRPAPGETVLVIGDGAVGLMACHAAPLFGAASVVLAGHHEDRLALGHRLGATHAVAGEGDELRDVLGRLTDGRGPEVVIASVCHPDAMRAACDLVRPGGRIGWVGMEVFFGPPDIPWDVAWFKNVSLTGGVCPSRRYIRHLWPLLEQGRIDPSPVFTQTVRLDEVPAAYAAMADREPGWVKVAVRP